MRKEKTGSHVFDQEYVTLGTAWNCEKVPVSGETELE